MSGTSVTVAFSASSSCAIGLPNRFERPTTTASAPSSVASTLSSSSSTPSGVHGRSPGTSQREPSRIDRCEAVHVLVGIDHARSASCRRDARAPAAAAGSPLTARVGVEQLEQVWRPARTTRRLAQPAIERRHARLRARALLGADVDESSRDPRHQHRRQARRPAGLLGERAHILGHLVRARVRRPLCRR